MKDEFKTGALDSFDYSAFIFVGIQAGISQATDSYPAFHQGAAGYGRYYWHTFADQTDENLWVEGILPSVLRQDSRYYTLGHGGVFKRGFYAVTRTVITRTDSGHETFNASEIVGAGTAARISSLYYPTEYRTWTRLDSAGDQRSAGFRHLRSQGILAGCQPRGLPYIRRLGRNAMTLSTEQTPQSEKHVVIVGGGFAGLNCARKVAANPNVRVTLLDKNNYHQFQPLLYQAATGILSPDNIAFNLRFTLLHHPNVNVKMAEVVSIDPHSRVVETADRQRYQGDFLVPAAGS